MFGVSLEEDYGLGSLVTEQFVKDQMRRNLTPNLSAQTKNSQRYQGAPVTIQGAVQNMIFRDSRDVLYDVLSILGEFLLEARFGCCLKLVWPLPVYTVIDCGLGFEHWMNSRQESFRWPSFQIRSFGKRVIIVLRKTLWTN